MDRLPGPKRPHLNRVPEKTEKAILKYSLVFPTHGCLRVAQQLALEGIHVSSGGVRSVWSLHKLLTKHERLLRLEETVRERKLELSESQIRLFERFIPEFRERHIETTHPGGLVAVDTFFVGTLKGVGKVYLQSVIDCNSRYGWGRLYTSKLPITAVHVLNTDVLPFFEKHNVKATRPSVTGQAEITRFSREAFLRMLQVSDHADSNETVSDSPSGARPGSWPGPPPPNLFWQHAS